MDAVVHAEKGAVHCFCPDSGEMRDMAFQVFEADRSALKYLCPAAAYGLECSGKAACHRMGGVQSRQYGCIVSIPLNTDRRIFITIPHGSPSWKKGYNRRSALERINNRVDHGYGFEKHFIRSLKKRKARMGLALAVMMAMALGHAQAGCNPSQ